MDCELGVMGRGQRGIPGVSKIQEYILQRLRLLCFDKSTHGREHCQQVAVEIKTGLIGHIYPWEDHKNVLVILSQTIR